MPNEDEAKKRKAMFEDDTDEAIVLPKPTPEVTSDDQRRADAAFEDQEIEIDEEELDAETESQPVGRKY
jgi:hypothetical protein